jgi:Rrf2 family protein
MMCFKGKEATMQVSNRFSIAVHMFACMEYFKKDRKITSDFLASSVGVNPVIIRKITSQLRDAGLVKVTRGTGGISASRAPGKITLLDVFNAVDSLDEGRLFSFHENPNCNCPVGSHIHLILDDKLERVQQAMEKELSSITIADVIRDTNRYAGGTAE